LYKILDAAVVSSSLNLLMLFHVCSPFSLEVIQCFLDVQGCLNRMAICF